ncbi:MAG: hypothetical protein Q9M94_00595 [Candidatus Gracilibacteria bacterium]|nr:hypothetical protein [Candidatus Gracilibacteria bacterium]MDQ7021993.1 hypothetical protein [Candidatus Gracilibacteria bacterium]
MARAGFVKQIESGNYGNYHIRKINGVKTPVSNPNYRVNNNLGYLKKDLHHHKKGTGS